MNSYQMVLHRPVETARLFRHSSGSFLNCRRTVLVGYRNVASKEELLRIIAKLGGGVADAETDIRRWSRGSV